VVCRLYAHTLRNGCTVARSDTNDITTVCTY
jgi:hypothetical protein